MCPNARYGWEKKSAVTLQSISQSVTIHISHCDCQDVYYSVAQLRPLSFKEALYRHALCVSYWLLSLFQHPWGRVFIGSRPIALPSRMTSNISLIRAAYKYLNTHTALTHGLCSKTLVICPAVSCCLLWLYLNWNKTWWMTDLELSTLGFWDNECLLECLLDSNTVSDLKRIWIEWSKTAFCI